MATLPPPTVDELNRLADVVANTFAALSSLVARTEPREDVRAHLVAAGALLMNASDALREAAADTIFRS